MIYTVHKGKRYKAVLSLGWLESLASNDTIKEKLEDVGFTDVEVTGDDDERIAEGTWDKDDASAEMPEQVVKVDEINA